MRPTSATAARRRWPRRKPAPTEFRVPHAGARKRGRRRRRARERGPHEGPQIEEIIMKTVVLALLAPGLWLPRRRRGAARRALLRQSLRPPGLHLTRPGH